MGTRYSLRSCYFKSPSPNPSPKGGALVLTFIFLPLSALARERRRVRSLGAFLLTGSLISLPIGETFLAFFAPGFNATFRK